MRPLLGCGLRGVATPRLYSFTCDSIMLRLLRLGDSSACQDSMQLTVWHDCSPGFAVCLLQDLAVNLTRYWPGNIGIKVPAEAQQRVPPGPAEITPCDVFRLIRGRTMWIIGCVARELLDATLSSLGSEDRVSVRGRGVRVQGTRHAVSENAG